MTSAALRPSPVLAFLASFLAVLGATAFANPVPALADVLPARSGHERIFGTVTVEPGEAVPGASSKVGDVRVYGLVGGDAGAFVGSVALEGPVGGDVETAFGDVRVAAPVGGSARTGMGDVSVLAPVGGDVATAFGDIYVDGTVGGNVEVEHGDVTLGPNARIGGDVVCGNGLCDRHEGARISGNVMSGSMNGAGGGGFGEGGGTGSWLLSAALLCGASLLAAVIAPRALASSAAAAGSYPGWSLLSGLGSVVVAAVGGVLLTVSGIGIPLLLLLIPAYLVLVLFGVVVVSYLIGKKVAFLTGGYRQGAGFAAVVGAAVVSLTLLLPFGSLLLVLVGLFGAGAVLTAFFLRRTKRRVV